MRYMSKAKIKRIKTNRSNAMSSQAKNVSLVRSGNNVYAIGRVKGKLRKAKL